jgi:hypothetical protein
MNDADDFESLEQEVGYGLCIFGMLPDAQRQRLRILQDQKRIERRQRRADIAQQGDARPGGISDRPQWLHRFGPNRTKIGRIRGIDRGLALQMRGPIEIATVDQEPADRIRVAAEIFGRGIHHNGGAVIERSHQDRRRVVDDQQNAKVAADFGNIGNGEHGEFRIW